MTVRLASIAGFCYSQPFTSCKELLLLAAAEMFRLFVLQPKKSAGACECCSDGVRRYVPTAMALVVPSAPVEPAGFAYPNRQCSTAVTCRSICRL